MHVFTTSDTCLHVALACTVAGHKTGNRINIAAVSSLINQLDPQTDQ